MPKERISVFEAFLKDYFIDNSDLCFYQGFADVAWAVFRAMTDENLTEEGLNLTKSVLSSLSRTTILGDAHRHNFDTIFAYLPCITAVVAQSDEDLAKVWMDSDMAQNHWAIGPLVSFFTHGGTCERVIGQVLDAIIAMKSQADLPLYLVASVPLLPNVKEQILGVEAMEALHVHEIITNAISNMADSEELVSLALKLQQRFPSKMLVKTALAAGAPDDSVLVSNVGIRRADSNSKLRKRSWRTLIFLGESYSETKVPVL